MIEEDVCWDEDDGGFWVTTEIVPPLRYHTVNTGWFIDRETWSDPEVKRALRQRIGVYVLRREDSAVYVGKADCLWTRVATHLRRREDIDSVMCCDATEVIESRPYREAKMLLNAIEAHAISEIRPLENKDRPKSKCKPCNFPGFFTENFTPADGYLCSYWKP